MKSPAAGTERDVMRWLAIVVVAGITAAAGPAPQPAKPLAKVVEDQAAEVRDLREEVRQLRAEIAALRKELVSQPTGPQDPSQPAAQPRGPSPADVASAIKQNRLLVGMTLVEARRAMVPREGEHRGQLREKLVREDPGGEEYEYEALNDNWRAVVQDGKVVNYERWEKEAPQTTSSSGSFSSSGPSGPGRSR